MTRVDWMIGITVVALVIAIIALMARGDVGCYSRDCGPGKRPALVDWGGCVCVERAR